MQKLALVWTPVDDQELRDQHYYNLKPGYGLRWVVTIKHLHLVTLIQFPWEDTAGSATLSEKQTFVKLKAKATFSHFSSLSKQDSDPPGTPALLQLYKTEPNTAV